MNKWKMAFWISVLVLIGVSLFSAYSILDQGVTLSYLRESCEDTESDLVTLVDLINETDLSRSEIKEKLKSHRLFEFMDFDNETIHIERVSLVFNRDRLIRIDKQW